MNRLKELRNQRKLTLDDIEEKTGIKRGTYSNYENNKTEPKIETWQKLARFFKVSVPYIQGLTYTTSEMIKVIHEFYFTGYDPKMAFSVYDDFSNKVNIYIKLTSRDVIPRELYKRDDKTFLLTQKVKDYWLTHFKQILNSEKFKNINKGDKYKIIFNLHEIIKNKIFYPESPHNLTSLGKFYMENFDKEKDLHKEAIDKIKYLDLSSARLAINQYVDLLKKLQKQVNTFKKDTFEEKDYNKQFANYVTETIYSIYEPDKYEIIEFSSIIDELYDRLLKDKKLKNFLLTNTQDKEYLELFSDYKKENKENTAIIDKYVDELKDRKIDVEDNYLDVGYEDPDYLYQDEDNFY